MATEDKVNAANNDPSEDTIEIKSLIWYRVDSLYVFFFCLLCVASLGSLLVVCYWFPRVISYFTGRKCRRREATHALIRDIDNNWNIVKLRNETLDNIPNSFNNINTLDEDEDARLILEEKTPFMYLLFRHSRYVMDDSQGVRKQSAFDEGYSCEEIYQLASSEPRKSSDRLKIYGPNLIDVPVKSYWRLFIEEVIDPFYFFQLFSIVIWLLVNYYYYAGAVFIISAVSITLSLYQTRKNMVQLKNMVAYSCKVTVRRGTTVNAHTSSTQLYPSDVIEIPPSGFTMPCTVV